MIKKAAVHFKKKLHKRIPGIFSATNIDDGVIITAKRHLLCVRILQKAGINVTKNDIVHGFITNYERFVDRTLGGDIAFKAGQIHKSQTLPLSILNLFHISSVWPATRSDSC